MHTLYKGTKDYPQERKRLFAYFYIIKICYRLISSICESKKKKYLKKNRKSLFSFFVGKNVFLMELTIYIKFNTLYIQLISFHSMVAKKEVERNDAF